ncbi:hypothetical protein GQ602_007328 [Ophiocordyceps camponoti-floridani]|uniref:Uncharacterized protein n=1 Tax=Ophiocordyceps camponoti-floridani TaxID=2030778 RepID=A0A8H4VAP5_9HYPO|nr:hypothetical protein GQ602_007328 [Ophiocordyceps camponoti-floridani]
MYPPAEALNYKGIKTRLWPDEILNLTPNKVTLLCSKTAPHSSLSSFQTHSLLNNEEFIHYLFSSTKFIAARLLES